MIETFRASLPATSEQIFMLVYKQPTVRKKCPKIRIQQSRTPKHIDICADAQQDVDNGRRQIQRLIDGNDVECYSQTMPQDQLTSHQKYAQLKLSCSFVQLSKKDIETTILPQLLRQGFLEAFNDIDQKLKTVDNLSIVISDCMDEVKPVFNSLFAVKAPIKAAEAPAAPTLLQADPVKIETRNMSKKMFPGKADFELDLKLNNKELFIAYLADLVTKYDERDGIIMFDRFDRLNIRGDRETCNKIKEDLKKDINCLHLLLIETKHLTDVNEMIRDLPKEWKILHFTKQRALEKCEQLIAQYYICEPKLILEEVSSNLEIMVFLVPKDIKKQFMRHVRKFTKAHGKQGPSSGQEGAFFTLATEDFKDKDEKDFRDYLGDMKLGNKDVVVHHHEGKTTIRVADARHNKAVEDYVHNRQCVLVIKADCEIVSKFIAEKQPTYKTAVLQLGVGYTRYTEPELFKVYLRKQEVKEEIINNTAQESTEKCHKVFYMLVQGMRSTVNAILSDFEQFKKNSLAANQQEWTVELPAYLENNYVSTERLISGYLDEEIKKIEKYVTLHRNNKKGWVYIATFPEEGQQAAIELVKDKFTKLIVRGLHSTTIPGFAGLRDIRTIDALSQMDNLIEHDNKVMVVSFGNIGDVHSEIMKLIEKAKQSEEVFIPINTYAIVKGKLEQYPKSDDLKTKIREGRDGMIFSIEGLPHRVKPILDRLRKDMEEAEGGMKTESFEVNREAYLILKNNVPIVEQLKKEHDVKIDVVEKKYDNAVLIRLGNFNKLELVADGLEAIGDSKMRVYTDLEDINNAELNKESASKKQYYNKEMNAMYLNSKDYPTINDVLEAAFSKKTAICMMIPNKMEINAAIGAVIGYLQQNDDQPSITLCVRSGNSTQMNSMLKRIEWILKDKSLKSLNIVDEMWHYEETKDMFREYNDKALKFLNAVKEAKVVANNEDLGITQTASVYVDTRSMQVYLQGIRTARLQQDRNMYFFDLNGRKCYFPESQTAIIEKSKNCNMDCSWYEIDFANKTQINLITQSQRRISLMRKNGHHQVQISPAVNIYQVKICAEKSRVERLKKIVRERIDKALKNEQRFSQTVQYPNKLISRQQFERLCEEGCLHPCPGEKELGDGINVEVKVLGYSDKDIQQLKNQLELLRNTLNATTAFSYPKHWTVNKNEIDLVEVERGSDEFREIQQQFKIAPITKLTRIQNSFLWKKYCQERQNQHELTMLPSREVMLFHGTKYNDPSKIYLDKEESFKINYAADTNMFGRGIYFAKEASYSDNGYAYAKPDGNKQMLYCKVNVGECQEMLQHQGRQDMKDTDIRDPVKNIRYGCRKSNYHGSDIYIIYCTGRAYPEYLIEYNNTVYGGDRPLQQTLRTGLGTRFTS